MFNSFQCNVQNAVEGGHEGRRRRRRSVTSRHNGVTYLALLRLDEQLIDRIEKFRKHQSIKEMERIEKIEKNNSKSFKMQLCF